MARQFGSYSPSVPLGITWEETLILEDENGDAINITGYDVRAQLYEEPPVRDPDTGIATVAPVLELTTAGYYTAPARPAPAWPVFEAFSIPTGSDGRVLSAVAGDDTWTASPDNEKLSLYWDVRLVNTSTGYGIPVVNGRVSFQPARTI